MDKLERLLNLTAALLDADRVLSANELRHRIGGYPEAKASFRRTFERDKEDLRKMGIPLRVENVPGADPPIDGYRILRSEYAGPETFGSNQTNWRLFISQPALFDSMEAIRVCTSSAVQPLMSTQPKSVMCPSTTT